MLRLLVPWHYLDLLRFLELRFAVHLVLGCFGLVPLLIMPPPMLLVGQAPLFWCCLALLLPSG
jgi:hypothetical protein